MKNWVSTRIDESFSRQEKKVARLLAWGYVQKQIADMLHIEASTVSVHLRNIYRKLSIHKETDLTRCWIFYENGIADNPLKRIVCSIFIVLACTAILTETKMVRAFRSESLRNIVRTVRPVRVKRYEDVFKLHLALTA